MAYTGLILSIIVLLLSVVCYLKILYEWRRKVKVQTLSKVIGKDPEKQEKSSDGTIKVAQAPGPVPWPILGSLKLLGEYEVPFECFTALAKKYGDVYSITLGSSRCLVVNNLELIREVLNQNGRYFGGRPDFLRFHRLFGGDRNNCE